MASDDDSVEVTRLSAVEAELVAAQLRGAGIHAGVIAVGTAAQLAAIQFSEGSRVMVRRADLAAARRILADLDEGAGPVSDAELAADAEAAKDWSDPESGSVV